MSDAPQLGVDRAPGYLDWYRWKWQRSNTIKPALEVLNGLVSAWCVIVYVYDTYNSITKITVISYLFASASFAIEYVAKLLGAKNKIQYVFFSDSVIDLGTIVAGVLYFVAAVETLTPNSLNGIRALRMFQVMRFFKALNTVIQMWVRKNINPSQLELVKESTSLFVVLSCVVFIAGSLFWELEGGYDIDGAPQYFHQAIYWACVTITTIGYGDFYPGTTLGQLLFPVMVILILIVVPVRIAAMTSALANINKYMRRVYKSWRRGGHVILLGNVNHLNAKTFIDEFFHKDRGMQEMELIIMRTEPLDAHISVLLSSHPSYMQLQYLQGSPFIAADMTRAALSECLAVYVMGNKFSQDPETDDTRTALVVLALAQYLRQTADDDPNRGIFGKTRVNFTQYGRSVWRLPSKEDREGARARHAPHIMAQFHSPDTIMRVRRLLDQQDLHPPELGLLPSDSTLYPLCGGFIKHALLGASVRCPGIQTMLTNLTTTYSVPGQDKIKGSGWVQEYLTGASEEIYEIRLSPGIDGLSYADAVKLIYLEHKVILIGVRQVDAVDDSGQPVVDLAPFKDLQSLEATEYVGYVLAPDRTAAYKASGLSRLEQQLGMAVSNPQLIRSDTVQDKSTIDKRPRSQAGTSTLRPVVKLQDQNTELSVSIHRQDPDSPHADTYYTPADSMVRTDNNNDNNTTTAPHDAADTVNAAAVQLALGAHNGDTAERAVEGEKEAGRDGNVASSLRPDSARRAGTPLPTVEEGGPVHAVAGPAVLAPPAQAARGAASALTALSTPVTSSDAGASGPSKWHTNTMVVDRSSTEQPHGADPQHGYPKRHSAPKIGEVAPSESGGALVHKSTSWQPLKQIASVGHVVSAAKKALLDRPSGASIGESGAPKRAPSSADPPLAAMGKMQGESVRKKEIKRLRRMSRVQPLTRVEDLTWPEGPGDLVILAGNSSFDHLDDIFKALCGNTIRFKHTDTMRSHVSPAPSSSQLAHDSAGPPAAASPFADPADSYTESTWRLQSIAQSRIVIMDPEGPSLAQISQIDPRLTVTHLVANPIMLAHYRRLHLLKGCVVRAIILPNLEVLTEDSALGEEACEADAQTVRMCRYVEHTAAQTIRMLSYVEHQRTNHSPAQVYARQTHKPDACAGSQLEVWCEAILFSNVPFMLPLCVGGSTYNQADTQTLEAPQLGGIDETAGGDNNAPGAGDTGQVAIEMGSRQATKHTHTGLSSEPHSSRPTHGKSLRRSHPDMEGFQSMRWYGALSPLDLLKRDCAAGCFGRRRNALRGAKRWMWKSSDPRLKMEARISKTLMENPGLTPALATGSIYTSTIIDKLFAQVVFMPLLLQIIVKMLGAWDSGREPERAAYASTGLPTESTALDTPSMTVNDRGIPTDNDAANSDESDLSVSCHLVPYVCLRPLAIRADPASLLPDHLVAASRGLAVNGGASLKRTKTFNFGTAANETSLPEVVVTPGSWQELLLACASHDVLPIGLYRRDPNSDFPYVYTAPGPETPLRDTDQVYVLASVKSLVLVKPPQ